MRSSRCIALLAALLCAFGLVVSTGVGAAQARSNRCGAVRITPPGGNGSPVTDLTPGQVPISAHGGSTGRGAAFDTTASEKHAAKRCADATESDYRVSADGVWVDRHDDNLATTTNCHGLISHMKWARIRHCRVRGTGNRVSSLTQDLQTLQPYGPCTGIGVQRELKVQPTLAQAQSFVSILEAHGFGSCTLVVSSSIPTLKLVKQLDPELMTGWITYAKTRPSVATLQALSHSVTRSDGVTVSAVDYLMLDNSVIARPTGGSMDYVATAHSLGFRVSVRSVNSASLMRIMINRFHVDRIVTDNVGLIRGARARLQ